MAIGLPASHTVRIFHHSSKDKVNENARKALVEMKCLELGHEENALDFKTLGSSALTLGERILVYVGETELYIKSACLNPAQFLDFGKNKRNIETFFELFNEFEKQK